ncbi:MAG: NAD-dependent succinate-semialdehyde dehydrogenase [Pseudomonadota bacterium]
MYTELKLIIDGKELSGDGRITEDVINPATEEVLGKLPHATKADLDAALKASARGFDVWRSKLAVERAKILRRAADIIRERQQKIALIQSLEQGKPVTESLQELGLSVETLDWMADEGRRSYGRVIPGHAPHARVITVQEPVGPVAAFTPWNFPALTTLRKISGALGAGCSLILKAAEETPGTAVEIVRAFHDAGVPPGVLQLVFGVPSDVSEYLLASSEIRKISFTGSTAVGAHLASVAARSMKRFTMELGGHAPVLVFPDADIDQTVALVAAAKFRNAGQVCVTPSRFYVHDDVYEPFVAKMVAFAQKLVVGPCSDPAATMGPLANVRRLEAMQRLTADAVANGAVIRTGGNRIGNHGFYFEPTVLAEVTDAAQIMSEETFGPIAPIARFSTMDEAIARANGLPMGLASYVYTGSEKTARIVSDRLDAGMVAINSTTVSLPQAPFGGVKASGEGHEGGIEGLEAYTVKKLIVHQ